MQQNKSSAGSNCWNSVSAAGDSGITPFGSKLHHYKLDDSPGLRNVLIGNMSFVGARPDVPDYADKLEGDTRPMLEIATEYNDTVIYPDKVKLNCYYYRHYSFWIDIEMIFATMLRRKVKFMGEEF